MSRLVVIGDTGGNATVLHGCLDRAGAVNGRVPPGTTVLHVGDVVRCHASFRNGNRESVELVAELLAANPESFIQLLGNHESAALSGPRRASWDVASSIDARTAALLSELWSSGAMRLASAFTTSQLGPVLVTHAGLTRSRWYDLSTPGSPAQTARAINQDVGRPLPEWARAGLLVGAEDDHSDTTWAEVNLEFYEPWILHGDAIFSQIHGHASPFNWQANAWWPDAPSSVRAATTVEASMRRTVTLLSPVATAISVDWNLGDEPWSDSPDWDLLSLDLLADS